MTVRDAIRARQADSEFDDEGHSAGDSSVSDEDDSYDHWVDDHMGKLS